MPTTATCLLLLSVTFTAVAWCRGVRVEFDPTEPSTGPFPTDFLTVPDERQRTGLRVDLPLPDCTGRASDCAELRLINQLDGFNPNPRLTVKFSAAINPDSLRDGVWLVWLDQTVPGRFGLYPVGAVTPINQVIYDPASFTAYAKPDEMLEQSRRFLIVVTNAVRDSAGDPVEPDPGFQACLERRIGGDYCDRLASALDRTRSSLAGRGVAGASLFTTLSASAWLEQAKAALDATQPEFRRPAVAPLPLSSIAGIVFHRQVAVTGENRFVDQPLPVPPATLAQAGVGRLAFGAYRSPRFLGDTLTIATVPTRAVLPPPQQFEEVPFHVWLPSRPAPEGGYPVLLAGHGLRSNRLAMPSVAAAAAASAGVAVVAINAFGHGSGPESTIRVRLQNGDAVEVPAPGRGLDITRDGRIDDGEGCVLVQPTVSLGARDCLRQTAMDHLQLIRTLRQGVDLDGDGRADLDARRIWYIGQSLGGMYGTALATLAPEVEAAVINVAPGNFLEASRLGPPFRPTLWIPILGVREPSLLNQGREFEEDIPLRYEPVRIRTVPGAAAIQDFVERIEWLEQLGAPAAIAPHLKQATLPGLPIKRVLFQMAWGDQNAPNPLTTRLVRAANLRETTSIYRFDRAKAVAPDLPDDPHAFLTPTGSPASVTISSAAFAQALQFLSSGREAVPDVNPLTVGAFGVELFETPEFLPETLNFLTPAPTQATSCHSCTKEIHPWPVTLPLVSSLFCWPAQRPPRIPSARTSSSSTPP